MKPRSIFSTLTLCLLAAGIMACSSDSHSSSLADKVHTPNSTGATVKRITYSGNFENVRQWAFTYTGTRNWVMQSATSTERSSETSGLSQSYTYRLNYGTDNVKITTDNSQYPITLTMNEGVIATAESGTTTYHYSYANGYLAEWNVIYRNESAFGGTQQKGAMARLTWSMDGRLLQIVYTPDIAARQEIYTYTYEYNDDALVENINGLLPELSTEAFGCNGLEFLYYAGLLGKGTTYLPSTLRIENTIDNTSVTYNMLYMKTTLSSGKEQISGCQYMVNDGSSMGVIATYGY